MDSIKPFLETINQAVEQATYGHEPAELYDPISYLMSLGGKRLRPALTLMAASLYEESWARHAEAALAVEVFHNFTLMHDDIMDAAPLRRGQPTVHEKWDTNTAILSGDVMLVAAYELLASIESPRFKHILRRFNRTAAEVCEGQQLDMLFASRSDVSEEEYIQMIRLKTSVLLGFALELGGLVANAPDEHITLLYEAGVNLGIGFQLKDDILDVYGDPEKFGKQVGGDIIENKKTWLLLRALEQQALQPSTHQELQKWLEATDFDKTEKVKAVTAIFDSLNIRDQALEQMTTYFEKGLAALRQLEVPEDRKQPLYEFADYLMARES